MPDTTSEVKTPVMLRISPALDAEVRRIAALEGESVSIVLRRLLRHGLDVERRAEAGR
jgi:hypothetical protein